MTVSITISETGFKGLLKLFSPSRSKRILIKALNEGRDFMISELEINSRFDTGKYSVAWQRRGSGLGPRTIVNIMPYAKYVTHPNQFTIHVPQAGAGDAFIALMTRKFRPEMRRITKRAIREEYNLF